MRRVSVASCDQHIEKPADFGLPLLQREFEPGEIRRVTGTAQKLNEPCGSFGGVECFIKAKPENLRQRLIEPRGRCQDRRVLGTYQSVLGQPAKGVQRILVQDLGI